MWGLSTVPSLDKRVKITILATGFGVKDVTEVKQKLDAEEEIRRQREADKQEENEERRNAFYGSDEKKGGLADVPKSSVLVPTI